MAYKLTKKDIEESERLAELIYQRNNAQQTSQPKRGGVASSLISEGGGLAGAAGGAALGTAILPGIGTIVGAGLGGLFGGTTGKLAEDKYRTGEFDIGAALKEGAIEGALSAGPLKLLRTGKAASKAIKSGSKLADVLADANKAAQAPGVLSKIGRGAQKQSAGFGLGSKTGGDFLNTDQTEELLNFVKKDLGLKGNVDFTSEKVAETALKTVKESSAKLDDILLKSTTKRIPDNELVETGQNIFNQVDDEVLKRLTSGDKAAFNKAMRKLQSAKNPADLVAAKRILQKGIKFDRNGQSINPTLEQIFEVFRKDINDLAVSKVPGLADLNRKISKSKQLMDLAAQSAARAQNTGGGILSRLVPDQVTDAGISTFGRNLERAGDFISKPTVGAATGGVVANLLDGGTQPQTSLEQALLETGGTGELGGIPGLGEFGAQPDSGLSFEESILQELNGGGELGGGTGTTNPIGISVEEIGQAIRDDFFTTGGKNFDELQDLMELVQSFEGGAGGGDDLNITKVTAQQFNNAQSGARSLDNLERILASDPGVLDRAKAPGRGIEFLGIGGEISNAAGTGQFDAASYNIADTLLRLRTGAQANETEVRKLQTQIMPRPGDDEETIRAKLSELRTIYNSILAQAQNSGATDPGFESLPVGAF